MTPVTCSDNILSTISFQVQSSKDKQFIKQMRDLAEQIKTMFENIGQSLINIRCQDKNKALVSLRNQVKSLVYASNPTFKKQVQFLEN